MGVSLGSPSRRTGLKLSVASSARKPSSSANSSHGACSTCHSAVPGFNGFVGEFLILVGAWPFSPTLVVFASLGVILAASYMLWMVKRVFHGEVTHPKNRKLSDLSLREAVILVPLVALAIFMGVASAYFTRRIEPAADALVLQVHDRTRSVAAAGADLQSAPREVRQ